MQMRTDAPPLLYKFRGVEHFKRDVDCLLRDRQVYLAKPHKLNDPYDLYPRLRLPPPTKREACIRRVIRESPSPCSEVEKKELRRRCELLFNSPVHRRRFLDEFYREDLDPVGVCSFSKPIANPVLWSHYASEHRGFAVGYRAQTAGALEAIPAFPVAYSARRPCIDPFFRRSSMLAVVGTKAREWAYEEEWRYVRPSGGAGTMDVPAGAIVEVCLGYRMGDWHRRRVISAARALPDKPYLVEAYLDEVRFVLRFRDVR